MLIAIRNETGFDLHLAISARESIRIRVTQDPPRLREGEEASPLKAGHSFGLVNCPEGIGVTVKVAGAKLGIGVIKRRQVIDGLDDDGEDTGPETYLEILLRLMN